MNYLQSIFQICKLPARECLRERQSTDKENEIDRWGGWEERGKGRKQRREVKIRADAGTARRDGSTRGLDEQR